MIRFFIQSLLFCLLPALAGAVPLPIITPDQPSANESLAAHEVRRYVYLRTGELLPIKTSSRRTGAAFILVARKDQPEIRKLVGDAATLEVVAALKPQEYLLKTAGDGKSLVVIGGDDVGTLYGAYALMEKFGVRFQLHGDTIPDKRIPFALPVLDETHAPLFALRGVQPFHDFPEGPDWWTREDWLSVVAQAAKMRLNFIGLHTYPFHNKDLGPEPTVWIGLPEDVNADGTVKTSDYASWYTTKKLIPYGCYTPEKTSAYSFGGAELFPTDDYGSEVNGPDDFPFPKTPAANAALINRTGVLLNDVFTEARRLGMTTCVGTESPLSIPDTVKAGLEQQGLDPDAPATLKKLYAGMFTRIKRAFPIDCYWIWSHEGEIDQARFITNVQCAQEAAKETKAPFGVGVSGWGWIAGNFPALDKALTKDVPFAAFNNSVGNAPVSPNFGALSGRSKWAIPWMEDDPGMTSPQLWVGRARKDAADALAYGCDGLIASHWRTRIMGPNIAALAQAGWDQTGWTASTVGKTDDFDAIGGQTAAFLNNQLKGTEDRSLYQYVRQGMRGYRISVPDGNYTVVLRFNEPEFDAPGKRVFGVNLQGRPVIEKLDIFTKAGQNAALDLTFTEIRVTGGALSVDFVPGVDLPCIAAIEVVGTNTTRKINCGGPAYKDFEADTRTGGGPRFLPSADYYADWARAEFGTEVAGPVAAMFTKLDGRFPRACDWNLGPGVVVINREPWAKVALQHAFVDELAALRPQVRGAGNLERFDWWLNMFSFNRDMAGLGCARGVFDALMENISKEPDAATRQRLAREEALPQRIELVKLLANMYGHLLAAVNNSSELGTLCNIEQQSMLRTKLITLHDAQLQQMLGEPLPAATQPWRDYRGPGRLLVLTARSSQHAGEALPLRIIALDKTPVKAVVVHVRPLGKGKWRSILAPHVARGVFEAKLPPASEDFEYYVTAGENLIWPAAAPQCNQTVVVTQ